VDHDWQAEGVRGQARSVHRHRTIVADRVGVEAYLDSDDNVAILRRGLHGQIDVVVNQVGVLVGHVEPQ
jgi:hypothetical protein